MDNRRPLCLPGAPGGEAQAELGSRRPSGPRACPKAGLSVMGGGLPALQGLSRMGPPRELWESASRSWFLIPFSPAGPECTARGKAWWWGEGKGGGRSTRVEHRESLASPSSGGPDSYSRGLGRRTELSWLRGSLPTPARGLNWSVHSPLSIPGPSQAGDGVTAEWASHHVFFTP